MKACLTELVGLSRIECACYDLDASLKKSSLNLFVDELEGIDLELIQNAMRCGDELQTNFETLYNNAVNFFESDLQVAIAENYKQKFSPFIGKAGEVKYSSGISVNTSNLAGIKLETKFVSGASIILSSISLFFNNTGSVTIQVYKNDEKFDEEFEIDITQEKTNFSLPTPLILPIVENGIKNEYYIVYEVGAMQPFNNKVSCGCAGIEQVRGKFLNVRGVKGSDFDGLSTDNFAYGLSLNVNISCSISNLLCDFMNDDTFRMRSGMAIWYKLGVLVIGKLFSSREINFDTFSDREYLYGRKSHYDKQYRNIIAWLSENTTINNSDCFICDSTKVMSMGKNLI